MPSPSDLTTPQLRELVNQAYFGFFEDYTKDELLGYIKKHPSTRFQKLLTSANVLNQIEKNRQDAQKAKRTAKKKREKFRRLAGKQKLDPQYDVEVEFSTDGEAFSNPIDVKSNTTYQCRMRLRQHQGEFNAIGFILDWKKTSNLSWADGKGTRTYAETISNPLVIARLVRTGTIAANTTAHVKVVIADRFL